MEQCSLFLRQRAEEISRKAAESVDAEEYEAPLCRLLEDLACGPFSDGALDTTLLREAGADDALVARLLRSAEAECIELARAGAATDEFYECVLAFRARFRQSVPRQAPPTFLLAVGRKLAEGKTPSPEEPPPPGTLSPEALGSRALTGFFQCIMDTQREMVYAHDVDGNLFYVNDAGLALVKFSREDLFDGMSIYDFVVPEYLDLVEARLESPGALFRSPYTIELYAKDGERVPVEIETRPMLDEHGDVVAVVGVARDLRLERRLQDEICRTHARLENVIGNAPIGIILTDNEGIIRDVNPAAVSLISAPDANALIGRPVNELGEQEGLTILQELHDPAEAGREQRKRVCAKTRYGAVLSCDVLVAPFHDGQSAVDGFLVLLLDVTEEVALQRNLIESEKLASLGEVIAGVAHEMNNPLTGVLGFAQLLSGTTTDPEVRSRLEQISEAAQRCRRIVECLLSFSRRAETSMSLQDVNGLVSEALDLCRYQLRIDGIEVSLDLRPNLPEVKIDPREIQQVFLHLVNNAHQALLTVDDRERTLSIKTDRDGDRVRCVFADNGPGIPPETLSQVFVPFYTTTKQGDRPGLGLSVAYGIVKEHGGDLLVDSAPGEGTTFMVLLPIVY